MILEKFRRETLVFFFHRKTTTIFQKVTVFELNREMAESTDSNKKPSSTESGKTKSRPQGGLGTVRTTSLFRAVNFELFARQNKYVMGFGLAALTGCVAYIAYLNATTENKRDRMYEEHHPDGTKEMSIKRSKWD